MTRLPRPGGSGVARPGIAEARAAGIPLLERTSWSSACAGSDQMTAPPDQATAKVVKVATTLDTFRAYARF